MTLFFLIFFLLFTFTHSEDLEITSQLNFGLTNPLTGEVNHMLEDKRGILYFAHESSIYEYDAYQWRTIEIGSKVLDLKMNKKGIIFVVTEKSIGYLKPNSFGLLQFITLKLNISKIDFFKFVEFNDEFILFTTKNSIYVFNDQFEFIKEIKTEYTIDSIVYWNQFFVISDLKKGLIFIQNLEILKDKVLENIRVKNFTFFNEERLFLNTIGNGILSLKINSLNKFHVSPLEQNLSEFREKPIHSFKATKEGLIIGFEYDGIMVLSRKLGILARTNMSKHLPSSEVKSIWIDPLGGIWVGTKKGIALLQFPENDFLKTEKNNSLRPLMRELFDTKTNTIIDGSAHLNDFGFTDTSEHKINLTFEQNALRFSISSNQISNKNKIQYRTKLIGYDREFSDWSDRNFREFTNLIWNQYEFQVQIRLKKMNGYEESEITSYHFQIEPPWHETWWFYMIQILIMLFFYLAAAVSRGTGKPDYITSRVNGMFLSIFFGLFYGQLGLHAYIGSFAKGIGFIKLILSALLGLFIKPIEKKLEKYLCSFTITPLQIEKFKKKIFRWNKKDERID